jgi:eukaryotic-like serine/threonine-protein kinase
MTPGAKETRERLFDRIRQDSEFPAMSQTVALLNKLESSNDSSSDALSSIILTDFALTLKILRMVNSVGYLQFGEVTTISRAIMLLGFENIRNIALTLLLFDHVGGSEGTRVKELLLRAICSGVLARNIAAETGFANVEEAFICSLFHLLGKIVVTFYMPEKIEEIEKLCTEKKMAMDVALVSVLGSSYEAIGMEIAGLWNLPKKVVNTMKTLRPAEIKKGPAEIDRLCCIANFADEISGIMASAVSATDKDERVKNLMNTYKLHFGGIEDMNKIVSSAASEVSGYAGMFGVEAAGLPLYRRLTRWGSETEDEASETHQGGIPAGVSSIAGILESRRESAPDTIFSKGVLEINTAILNSYPLNDVIKIALETIYRGMNFTGVAKVLFLLRDSKTSVMKIKFGFGGELFELRQWFELAPGRPTDIFNIALSKPADLVIRDITTPDIKPLLPSWYAGKVSKDIFVIILPVVVNKNPIGLFYIEGDKGTFGMITSEDLKYLTLLRDQTVLAVKQKYSL